MKAGSFRARFGPFMGGVMLTVKLCKLDMILSENSGLKSIF